MKIMNKYIHEYRNSVHPFFFHFFLYLDRNDISLGFRTLLALLSPSLITENQYDGLKGYSSQKHLSHIH